MTRVVVLTTGEELLHGTTTDTNSAFISRHLFGSQLNVIRHVTVGDDLKSITEAIIEAMTGAEIVFITGGLGPTDDDNTVEAVCSIFNFKCVIEPSSEKRINDFFNSMRIRINDKDYKMAAVPDGAFILSNSKGLAPGFIVEKNNRVLIALPGVPPEAEKMFEGDVIPFLKKRFNYNTDNRIELKVTGIRESDINSIIDKMGLPGHITWGVSAKYGICDLFFTSREPEFYNKHELCELLKKEFSAFIISDEFHGPEGELLYLLRGRQLTISTAESCTGGFIGKRLTDVAGSSDVFTGSVTAYSNTIKTEILGVPEKVLENYGAVSEETAAAMAEGIQRLFGTDIGVSVTGIAGPGGGTEEKPVGTVCFGFKINDKLVVRKMLFRGDRDRIRTFASLYAINFLRNYYHQ
ncbi:MAG TPA: CinA family nicotinamide mononucleotide deamidase-related protein [Spirochaetota bacterium]|nr:CinA family nicotinamide mononucleotide deamidase-related protein [Spirochaetota bacterium]